MPGKARIHVDLDDLLQRHAAGESIASAAKRLGVNRKTLDAAVLASGRQNEVRSPREPAAIPDDKIREVLNAYDAGASVLKIAKASGLQRAQIARIVRLSGRAVRGRSEAERLKWERLKQIDGATERQCSAAWRASRGIPKSDATKAQIARTNEARVTRVGAWEAEIAAALKAHGVHVVQQRAAGPYNIDIALVSCSVAVEVLGAHSHAVHAAHHRKKSEYLRSEGWAVVWVYAFGAVDVGRVADDVIAHAEITRRDEAARGQDRVIRCDGKTATPSGLKVDGWPLVVTTHARDEHA
jgi:very-short-patch-repair endonuclease/uncharacterized protein (DUF433 family)